MNANSTLSGWWVIVGVLLLAVIYDASAAWGGFLLIILVFGMLGVGHQTRVLDFPQQP